MWLSRPATGLLRRTGLDVLLTRAGSWRGVLILAYHRIGDASSSMLDRTLFVRESELDEQLAFLARTSDCISPDEMTAVLARRRGRAVLITFDDGYRDNHALALPLLRRHGLSATWFLATGFIGQAVLPWWDQIAWMVRASRRERLPASEWLPTPTALGPDDREAAIRAALDVYKRLPPQQAASYLDWLSETTGTGSPDDALAGGLWMTWEMVSDLARGGMTIGGHTVTHPVLANLPEDAQYEEIHRCAAQLRAELGIPMRYFCYPTGAPESFDDRTRAVLRQAGVEFAFSLSGGYLRPGRLDPLDVPRCAVTTSLDPDRFYATVSLPQVFARW